MLSAARFLCFLAFSALLSLSVAAFPPRRFLSCLPLFLAPRLSSPELVLGDLSFSFLRLALLFAEPLSLRDPRLLDLPLLPGLGCRRASLLLERSFLLLSRLRRCDLSRLCLRARGCFAAGPALPG